MRLLSALIASLALASTSFCQTPAPSETAGAGQQTDAKPAPPTVPVDPAAQALWDKTCDAMLYRASGKAEKVSALDLELDVLARDARAGSNVAKPRVRWLAPGYIRIGLPSGRENGRGPDGDWLVDGGEVKKLEGRDAQIDREQFALYLMTIGNFVALTQPSMLKIQGLRLLEDPPPAIPKRHPLGRRSFAKDLVWLEFESADFRLDPKQSIFDQRTYRVSIAVHEKTSYPVLALITDPTGKSAPNLLKLDDIKPMDDMRMPRAVFVFPLSLLPTGWTIAEMPNLELYVTGGTVRARLEADDFLPPKG